MSVYHEPQLLVQKEMEEMGTQNNKEMNVVEGRRV